MDEQLYFEQFSGYNPERDEVKRDVIYEREGWVAFGMYDQESEFVSFQEEYHYHIADPQGRIVQSNINLSGHAIRCVNDILQEIEVARWKAAYESGQR